MQVTSLFVNTGAWGSSIEIDHISTDDACYLREVLTYDHEARLGAIRKALETIIQAGADSLQHEKENL